jgi:hypothetical protein
VHFSPSCLLLWHRHARVRVSVYDTSPTLPMLRQPRADDQCGRGLGPVEALSDGWGVTDSRLGLPIKGVWFELDHASRTA